MSSLNNNLSECITLGDSSLAVKHAFLLVAVVSPGLACIQGDQTCVSLHLPAPRGERKEHEQQNLHSTHSGRSGVQRFQSSYLFALGKYQKTRWAQGALDSLWVDSNTQIDQRTDNVTQYYFPPRGDQFSNTRVWQ